MDRMASMKFEETIQDAYRRYAPLAQRFYYTFSRPTVTVGGVPCALFLGNHSSGKSSLVNWVLGGDVQDTGVAPTDDGFTVILYGEREEDVCGPAALMRLPGEFQTLQTLGPMFLQHLKVKVRPLAPLKQLVFIDSPGMIDAAQGTVARDYDFHGAVRQFAERADTVFFLFDPDKPGTTGETMDVFARSLRGLEFKVRVLLNKCDMFASLYDFARTYGTVCWNLARVLHTKDLPKIYTMYTGPARTPARPGMDFSDFDRHRAEFQAILSNGPSRRADAIRAAAYSDFTGLAIRMAVVGEAARRLRKATLQTLGTGLLVAAAAGCATGFACLRLTTAGSWVSGTAGALTGGLVLYAAFQFNRLCRHLLRKRLAGAVDDIYADVYRRETAVGRQDDLRQTWDVLRDETASVILSAPLSIPWFAGRTRRRLEALAANLLAAKTA